MNVLLESLGLLPGVASATSAMSFFFIRAMAIDIVIVARELRSQVVSESRGFLKFAPCCFGHGESIYQFLVENLSKTWRHWH